MKSFHLPGLNGIRTIAAMSVLLAHTWQFQYWFGFDKPSWVPYKIAAMGVTLFFVLSGFLITYLLMQEKDKFKTISVKKFYVRRILRIWPLYYALLLLSFLLIDHESMKCLYYYFFFVPNWAFALGCVPVMIAPFWSVGVEEQFYLIWPILLKYSKRHLLVLSIIIIIYFIIKVYVRLYGNEALNIFVGLTRIDCMAIGGIGAWWALSKPKRRFIFNFYSQVFLWMLIVFFIFQNLVRFPDFIEQEIYSVVFIGLILNISLNPKPIISLQTKLFDYVGRISYGIYLTHMFILFFLSKLLGDIISTLPGGIVLYGLTCLAAVLIASSLSYFYFESYFIRLKSKFMMIDTAIPTDKSL
jgi:peptidoglycan/LPS O-acetylase OafA/YrhL